MCPPECPLVCLLESYHPACDIFTGISLHLTLRGISNSQGYHGLVCQQFCINWLQDHIKAWSCLFSCSKQPLVKVCSDIKTLQHWSQPDQQLGHSAQLPPGLPATISKLTALVTRNLTSARSCKAASGQSAATATALISKSWSISQFKAQPPIWPACDRLDKISPIQDNCQSLVLVRGQNCTARTVCLVEDVKN